MREGHPVIAEQRPADRYITQRRPLHNEGTHSVRMNPSASASAGEEAVKIQTATEKVNEVFQTECTLKLNFNATGKCAIFPANCMKMIYSKDN